MPRTTLSNNQIVDLVDTIKESGSKQRKSDVIEQAYMLLEDVPVSNPDETAALIWNVYKYGISKLPEEKKVKSNTKKPGTKVELCREIMKECWSGYKDGSIKRKDILLRFQTEGNLSEKGSATYFYNIKGKMDDSTK